MSQADSAALENQMLELQGRTNFHTMDRFGVGPSSLTYDIATSSFPPSIYMDSNRSHLFPHAPSLMEDNGYRSIETSFIQAVRQELTEFPQHSWARWTAGPMRDYGGIYDFYNDCSPLVDYLGENPDAEITCKTFLISPPSPTGTQLLHSTAQLGL
jgi:hypothetical protein